MNELELKCAVNEGRVLKVLLEESTGRVCLKIVDKDSLIVIVVAKHEVKSLQVYIGKCTNENIGDVALEIECFSASDSVITLYQSTSRGVYIEAWGDGEAMTFTLDKSNALLLHECLSNFTS